MLSELLLLPLLLGQADPGDGSIDGVVLNGSANRAPVAGAEVVLRARLDGEFQPVAETTTDDQGRFSFEQLPIDETIVYLPGANRDGVHYPGKRVRPSPRRPNVHVELTVYDAVAHPCPLVIERHEIEIRPAPGVLRVREVLVDRESGFQHLRRPTCQRDGRMTDSEPVTLRLAIPSDFERVTFDKEFFGRRFSVVDADARHPHSLDAGSEGAGVYLSAAQREAITGSSNVRSICHALGCGSVFSPIGRKRSPATSRRIAATAEPMRSCSNRRARLFPPDM